MYYTVYKTTNLLNGKFYIGKHQTKDLDDDYFGSGELLKRAIKKHGKENFKKEILELHETEEAMNAAERRLVIVGPKSYNLNKGGHGNWHAANQVLTKEQRVINGKKATNQSKAGSIAFERKIGIFSDTFIPNTAGLVPGGNKGLTYKQKNHNMNSHPRGPRGPYKKCAKSLSA